MDREEERLLTLADHIPDLRAGAAIEVVTRLDRRRAELLALEMSALARRYGLVVERRAVLTAGTGPQPR